MASVASFNDLLTRIGAGFSAQILLWGETLATTVALGGNTGGMAKIGGMKVLPALPSGVTAFIPTMASLMQGAAAANECWIVEMVNLGSLDIAGPTFTDGVQMPSYTELGTSRQIPGAIWIEVTTALNATPGSLVVTYVDQNGNAPEATTAQAMGASTPLRTSGFINLNSPDFGAIDITTANRTGGTTPTGVVKFWGIIPVAAINTNNSGIGGVDNLITNAFLLRRLAAGAQLGVFVVNTTTITARAMSGHIYFIGDS